MPEPLLRSAKNRLTAIFSSTPLLFLGVVIGVAVLFKIGIGFVKPSNEEPMATAPVFTSTPSAPAVAATTTAQPIKLNADPAAMPLPVEPPAKGKKHGRSQFPRR